jgi:hypothetical protein
MKAKIFLQLLFLFFVSVGCVSKKYVYVKNKTEHNIQIYKTDTYDIPENNSLIKMILQEDSLYGNYETGKLTQYYYGVLKPDSLAFLDIIYGEKSKTELVDSNSNYFSTTLIIVSKSDTILFNQKEIIKKINEVWTNRNFNSPVKLRNCLKIGKKIILRMLKNIDCPFV